MALMVKRGEVKKRGCVDQPCLGRAKGCKGPYYCLPHLSRPAWLHLTGPCSLFFFFNFTSRLVKTRARPPRASPRLGDPFRDGHREQTTIPRRQTWKATSSPLSAVSPLPLPVGTDSATTSVYSLYRLRSRPQRSCFGYTFPRSHRQCRAWTVDNEAFSRGTSCQASLLAPCRYTT